MVNEESINETTGKMVISCNRPTKADDLIITKNEVMKLKRLEIPVSSQETVQIKRHSTFFNFAEAYTLPNVI